MIALIVTSVHIAIIIKENLVIINNNNIRLELLIQVQIKKNQVQVSYPNKL